MIFEEADTHRSPRSKRISRLIVSSAAVTLAALCAFLANTMLSQAQDREDDTSALPSATGGVVELTRAELDGKTFVLSAYKSTGGDSCLRLGRAGNKDATNACFDEKFGVARVSGLGEAVSFGVVPPQAARVQSVSGGDRAQTMKQVRIDSDRAQALGFAGELNAFVGPAGDSLDVLAFDANGNKVPTRTASPVVSGGTMSEGLAP